MARVIISKEAGFEWLVWLDGAIAGRFGVVGEALDFAEFLECSPRARACVEKDG